MSTTYYHLQHPVTRFECHSEMGPAIVWLTVYLEGKSAGSLAIPKELIRQWMKLFIDYDSDMNAPLRTHWGGADVGSVVTVNENLPDDAQVISEYGELLTVGQVKARHGAKRADGWPTELFGYENGK